ncbi:MAG: SAM-dependent chlorinase/fluorinase, partial [Bacteroidetes bacterium]|nr:SAM-dependent chlorinase/fluorinase [Bacteroidota bacterium]
MAIITLTTDLGYKDFYQAALKGSILNQFPGANIVDISHQISA